MTLLNRCFVFDDEGEWNDVARLTAAYAAKGLFPNMGLQTRAEVFAASHPRAFQYLEQAPVLIFGAGVIFAHRGSHRATHRHASLLREFYGPLFDAGAPLKTVMERAGLSMPLRRLKPSIMAPYMSKVLRHLVPTVDAQTLGNLLPKDGGAQRAMMSLLGSWVDKFEQRTRDPTRLIGWAFRQVVAHRPKREDLRDVADLAGWRNGAEFDQGWSFPQAFAAHHVWAARLAISRQAGDDVAADTVICKGMHPDHSEVAGYEFVALRTPRAIGDEGAAMHHCVASYARSVMQGQSRIVGIRKDGKRVATLELGPAYRPVQLRGPCNDRVAEEVSYAVRLYALGVQEVRRQSAIPVPGFVMTQV